MRVPKPESNRGVVPLLLVACVVGAQICPVFANDPAPAAPVRYVVQAATTAAAADDVKWIGGKVERKLDVIHAVSAYLDASQAAHLRALPDVHLFADRRLHTQ
jgi:hypothetical protein